MDMPRQVVSNRIKVLNLHDNVEIPVRLSYDAGDPLAVKMIFEIVDGPVVWTFGRSLLAEGLTRRSGDGDVVIEPYDGNVRIHLSSPDGRVTLIADTGEVSNFVAAAMRTVPLGKEEEMLDMDALINELLS